MDIQMGGYAVQNGGSTAELMDRIALAQQQVESLEGQQRMLAHHELELLETELEQIAKMSLSA